MGVVLAMHIFPSRHVIVFAIFQDRNFNIMLASNFLKFLTTLSRLQRCAGWFKSLFGTHVRRYILSHCSSVGKELRWMTFKEIKRKSFAKYLIRSPSHTTGKGHIHTWSNLHWNCMICQNLSFQVNAFLTF